MSPYEDYVGDQGCILSIVSIVYFYERVGR